MGDIFRHDTELRRRQQEGQTVSHAMTALSRKRAAEFITLMQRHNVPATGCYRTEIRQAAPAIYHRIGGGWIIQEANDPRDRQGTVLLESGDNYPYEDSAVRLAQSQINERPFLVVTSQGPNVTEPISPQLYADEQGLDLLVWAARSLGALPPA
jgi:hypothetical protein